MVKILSIWWHFCWSVYSVFVGLWCQQWYQLWPILQYTLHKFAELYMILQKNYAHGWCFQGTVLLTWINLTHACKVWDKIWEWMINFTIRYNGGNYLSMQGLKLIHVSKKGYWYFVVLSNLWYKAHQKAIKLLITQMKLEHLSALLQLHLHSRLSHLSSMDWAKTNAMQDKTRNI